MKKLIQIFLLSILLFSCKKEESTTTSNQTSCSPNNGSFNLSIEGENYDMIVDNTTNFSILYNWYGNHESNFVIDSKDQNGNPIYSELLLPGSFNNGVTTYTNDTLSVDFFTIDIDTFNLYISEVTFEVLESNLSLQDGIYRPVTANFNGIAHSFPWYAGQPPTDTIAISGSFCLNGVITP